MLDSYSQDSVNRRRLLQYGSVGCVALALPQRLQANQDLSLGAMHNAALDWFSATERNLKVNPDGTLSVDEFRRLLSSTMTYAGFANDVLPDIDRNLDIAVKATSDFGLIETEGRFGPAIKNDNRLYYTSVIRFMEGKRAISSRLANELQQLHQQAERFPDGNAFATMVFRRLLGQYWNEKDQQVVDRYLDVFAYSTSYWQEVQESDPLAFRKKWWIIGGADALGVIGGAVVGWFGFGAVGAVVGGLTFGAGFSAVASTW